MLKVLFWLLWEVFFIYIIVTLGKESGNYIYLFLAFLAFFTWELYNAIKN